MCACTISIIIMFVCMYVSVLMLFLIAMGGEGSAHQCFHLLQVAIF